MATWQQLPKELRQAINEYVTAKIVESWKGSKEPAEWGDIDQTVIASQERLAKEILSALKG